MWCWKNPRVCHFNFFPKNCDSTCCAMRFDQRMCKLILDSSRNKFLNSIVCCAFFFEFCNKRKLIKYSWVENHRNFKLYLFNQHGATSSVCYLSQRWSFSSYGSQRLWLLFCWNFSRSWACEEEQVAPGRFVSCASYWRDGSYWGFPRPTLGSEISWTWTFEDTRNCFFCSTLTRRR